MSSKLLLLFLSISALLNFYLFKVHNTTSPVILTAPKCDYSLPVIDWQPRETKNLSDRIVGISGATIKYIGKDKILIQDVLIKGRSKDFAASSEDFKLSYDNTEAKQIESDELSKIPSKSLNIQMGAGETIKGKVAFVVPENKNSFILTYQPQNSQEKAEFQIYTKMPVTGL